MASKKARRELANLLSNQCSLMEAAVSLLAHLPECDALERQRNTEMLAQIRRESVASLDLLLGQLEPLRPESKRRLRAEHFLVATHNLIERFVYIGTLVASPGIPATPPPLSRNLVLLEAMTRATVRALDCSNGRAQGERSAWAVTLGAAEMDRNYLAASSTRLDANTKMALDEIEAAAGAVDDLAAAGALVAQPA